MIVRLLKHWNGRKPGHVFSAMAAGAARVLVRRGLAEEVVGDGDSERRSGGGPPPLPARPAAPRRGGRKAAAADDYAG
jgi:hypothetical protein